MTVDVSGIAGVQARMAEIQSRFGAPATTAGGSNSSTGSATFDSSMRQALAKSQGAATAASPFVYDPTAAPGGAQLKSGAAAALAAPTAATAARPAAVGATTTSGAQAVGSAAATAPAQAVGATSGATVDRLIAAAKQYLGVPYKWGGTNPATGLDCSGFTQRAFKDIGIAIPRVARDQQDVGTKVASLAAAKPGDLLFFGDPAHHVTMYLGNNKMIHAPRTGQDVKIVDVYAKPTSITRILPESAFTEPNSVTRGDGPLERSGTATPASLQAASSAAATAMLRSASAGSLGGWNGAPVADTWGGAAANAATMGVDQLTAGAGSAPASVPVSAPAAATSVAAVSGSSAGGVLAQAPASLRALFTAAAQKYGVSADLLAAVAKQESGFKATAVSPVGARGLMQLMPGTARGLGVTNSFDPGQAIDGAARLLKDHLRTFGSTELALAAYNAGPGAVRRYDGVPPYSETQNYVRKIMSNLKSGAL